MSHKNKRRNREKRRGPPTLADIVRQETDNGRTIVRFYLDVANGKLDDEGFEACHRRDAAKEIQAIAPELVADAIARLAGIQCHPERRGKRPTTVVPAEAGTHPRPRANTPNRHEALEYLASALAAPSLADDPRVTGIVRESTDQGKTVVSFLLHVMHGVVRGFRPNNRMGAAMELIGHIARDELRADGFLPADPVSAPAAPALSSVEGPKAVRPELVEGSVEAPAPAATESSSPAAESSSPAAESSFPKGESSFPRRACPVLDTGREPIPGPNPAEADPAVIPAESLPRTRYGAGIQQGGDGDDADDPRTSDAAGSSFPSSREPIPGPSADEAPNISTKNSKPKTKNSPDSHRGCYDIDLKIAQARRDPSHPIHKFVQAYDEVAAAFHGDDNDDDEEVRYWISGEVPDAYGKYIWEYAPAYPRSIRRRLRPRRRRSREPGTAPKGESIWMKRPNDKMREAGVPPPKRTLIWV